MPYAQPVYGTNGLLKALALPAGSFTIRHYQSVKQFRISLWPFTPFSPRQPAASARLPLTLISLDDWALATLTGADAEKYLQGQVTADVSR